MAVRWHDKRAPRWGALFAFMLAVPFPSAACSLDHADETARVAYVYDGDTIRLSDGRKVRFVGVNTPEIDHDGGNSQPYAKAARLRVEALIGGGTVQLRYASERKDHYGRLLAHPYLPDGRSISTILLDEGLAAAIAVSPNLWQNDCYFSHERKARAARRGIWSGDSLFKQSRSLHDGDQGFALLRGRVEKVVESRHSLWLELEGEAALRIARDNLHYFNMSDLSGLSGHDVEARGWLTYHKGKWHMNISHPVALRMVNDN
jgi:micrococcal nuclease